MALRDRERNKHEQIIQAAVKVFAKKGFFNAKVSEIAREANVADGTIYLYFKNKDDILISLFEERMDHLIRQMQQELAKVDHPLEKIRVFVSNHLLRLREDKHLAEVLQIELRQSSKFMRRYVPVKFLQYLDLIGDIIEEGKAKGCIQQEIIPAIAKRAIFGALDEMSLYWVLAKKPKYTLEQCIEQMSDIFIHGLKAREDHSDSQPNPGDPLDQQASRSPGL